MWIIYAIGSALFAGITSILAKCGIKKTDSNVAAAVRTVVVLFFAWLMVFAVGSQKTIRNIDGKTMGFLVLSGLATGASWLCFFRALQLGDINKVTPVDKSSTVLTILLSFVILGEPVTWEKAAGVLLIGIGTLLMIQKKEISEESCSQRVFGRRNVWLFYAVLSAVFASLTSILGKIGIAGVESNLGTAIRTAVVLVMAWVVVFVTGKQHTVRQIEKNEAVFICLSGLATGISWLCYYRALQEGPASVIVPVDKLSILVTIGFSYLVFHEKLSKKAAAGLVMIVTGTMLMVF